MSLFGKLFLAQFIQDIEFFGKIININITNWGKFDFHNNLSIGHHHCDTSEKHFKIFWKFLTTSITGVHCNEITNGVNDFNIDNFFGEEEFTDVLFFGLSDWFDLTSNDGKHFKINTIEFIEASPDTGLAQSFKDFSHINGSMLIGAIGDNDENTKGSS